MIEGRVPHSMKVVQINVTNYGSTGAIVNGISRRIIEDGGSVTCFFGRLRKSSGINSDTSRAEEFRVGGRLSLLSHVILARLGGNGHGSYFATKALCRKLLEMKPDVIVLHNIHGYYLNVKLLWETLAALTETKVYWYLHDSWSYTGGCAYYSAVNCEKWKKNRKKCLRLSNCGKCPCLSSDYPVAYIDTTRREYFLKRRLFTALPEDRLTLISPSDWLAGELSHSFLSIYPRIVKHTEPDRTVFYRRSREEQAAALAGIAPDKAPGGKTPDNGAPDDMAPGCNAFGGKIVLAVSMVWDNRKQPEMVLEVAKLLPEYTFIMVGLKPGQIRKMTRKGLPGNVFLRGRTSSREELAALYSAADVLLNPSLEDNYPLVPLEAQCCGTPVVSSNCCGNPETVTDGIVVDDPRSAADYAEGIRKLLA